MKCIVKTNEGFKIVPQEGERPERWVFSFPQRNASPYGYRYHLVENSVDTYWTNGTHQGHYIAFSKNQIEFKRINNPTMEVVLEQLNDYVKTPENEIDDWVEQAGNNKIKVLSEEIAEITVSRDLLNKECKELAQILELGNQLSSIINKQDIERSEGLKDLIKHFNKI